MVSEPQHKDDAMREAFEKWYYSQWSHGETLPAHYAHKAGCLMAWQAAQTNSAAVIEKLVDFVRHHDNCDINHGGKCTCYLDEALALARGTR